MAIDRRKPPPGCINHYDRGEQYASKDYIKELEYYKFQISMSRKGNPYDNGFTEIFMRTLRSEEVHLWEYCTMEDALRHIPYFIIYVYNHERLHSAIVYYPPSEFEFLSESARSPLKTL